MTALDTLFAAAKSAYGNAYAPYSRFPVGAALRDELGRIHAAANAANGDRSPWGDHVYTAARSLAPR